MTEVVHQIVAVPTGPQAADPHQPGPDLFGRRVDGDRAGGTELCLVDYLIEDVALFVAALDGQDVLVPSAMMRRTLTARPHAEPVS